MYLLDYNDLFTAHDAKQSRELERLPKCADCCEPIQDEHFFLINDEPICPACLEAGYMKRTEDYVE